MKIDVNKLRIAMADSCVDVNKLVSMSNIKRSTYDNIIRGKNVRSSTMGRIAATLGVPAESLILDEKAEQKRVEAERSELLLKYATLSEKQQELSEKGLTFAADMLGKELKSIQEKLG